MDDKTPKTEATSRDAAPPTPRPGSLRTHDKLLKEMGRLYRDARQGLIRPADATKMAFILAQMARLIDSVELREIEDDSSSTLRLIEIFAAGRAARAKEAAAAGIDPHAPPPSIEAAIDDALGLVEETEPDPQEGEQQERQVLAPAQKRQFVIPAVKKTGAALIDEAINGGRAGSQHSSGVSRSLEEILDHWPYRN